MPACGRSCDDRALGGASAGAAFVYRPRTSPGDRPSPPCPRAVRRDHRRSVTIPASISYEDRREHERKPLRIAAQVLLPNAQVFDVRMLDISAGGAGILAPANPQKGTQFVLRVAIPKRPTGNTPCDLPVEVTHSIFSSVENGFKIGLRFTRLDATSAGAIVQFIG